jgi:hypothetical protein
MTPELDHRSGRLLRLVLGVLLVVGVLAGCGQHRTAGQAAPQVKSALTQVETALAAHQYSVARRGLNALIQHALTARRSGTLSAEQADRILAAAARVKADLPAAAPTPSASPSQTGEEDSGKGNGDEHKKHHGDRHD